MSAQTSYSLNQAIAYAGLIYAQAPHDIISRKVEGVDGIELGTAVSRGTNKETQAVKGGDDFIGITIRSLDKEGAANGGLIKWNEKESAGIIRDGYVWAICPTGCAAGDPVKYNTTSGVLDAGSAGVGENLLNDAQWETTASAGALAVIRLNSTNTTAGS